MAALSYQSSATRQPASLRRRGLSFVLAIAAHLLLLLLLLKLSPSLPPPPGGSAPLSTFNVADEARTAAASPSRPKAAATRQRAPAPAAQRVPPPVIPPPPAETPPPFPTMLGGKELFRSADIGKLPTQPGDSAGSSGAGDSGSGDSVAAYGPGAGPGGQQLYNAQWYREPTNAELAFYLPRNTPKGAWAMIACRTIERYGVDNCRALGESPPGSGLARAMREAAWQFRVLPPRLGGKTLVGAWVRIRIDFTELKEK